MPKLMAAMLAMAAAMAQLTVVTEPAVHTPGGTPVQGEITITASAPWSATDGTRVEQAPTIVRLKNGAFSVSLEPTPTGYWYNAAYQLDGARPRTDHWCIPTSGSPVGLSVVVVTTIPCTAASIGAGGALSLATLNNPQLAALTNGQLAALTN